MADREISEDKLTLDHVNSIGDVLCNLVNDEKSLNIKSNQLKIDGVESMEDDHGPEPMRNFKPTEKRRTGAEDFDILHQGVYDNRAAQHNRISNIYQKAYPEMRDELTKKRSTARVTMKNARTRQLLKSRRKQASRSRRTKITKRVNERPKRGPRPKGVNYCKRCNEVCLYDRKNPKKYISNNKRSAVNGDFFTKKHDQYDYGAESKVKRSITTVTTYSSFLSLEHEPMV